MEGRVDDARREIERAVELEPLSVVTAALRGFQLNLAGDHARELEQARATVDLDPNHFLGYWSLGLAYEHAGRMADSAAAIRRAAALAEDNPIVTAVLARAEALAGRHDEARRILAAMESDRRAAVLPTTSARPRSWRWASATKRSAAWRARPWRASRGWCCSRWTRCCARCAAIGDSRPW